MQHAGLHQKSTKLQGQIMSYHFEHSNEKMGSIPILGQMFYMLMVRHGVIQYDKSATKVEVVKKGWKYFDVKHLNDTSNYTIRFRSSSLADDEYLNTSRLCLFPTLEDIKIQRQKINLLFSVKRKISQLDIHSISLNSLKQINLELHKINPED